MFIALGKPWEGEEMGIRSDGMQALQQAAAWTPRRTKEQLPSPCLGTGPAEDGGGYPPWAEIWFQASGRINDENTIMFSNRKIKKTTFVSRRCLGLRVTSVKGAKRRWE